MKRTPPYNVLFNNPIHPPSPSAPLSVPEPGSVLLLCTVLAGVAGPHYWRPFHGGSLEEMPQRGEDSVSHFVSRRRFLYSELSKA